MSTLRSMIPSDAEPPSVQRSASVVSGDVMEIAKLMVLLICISLTACGLYQNRCTPSATQSQASSSHNFSAPPPTKPISIAGAVEILNSIESSLENVLTSVLSSDNDTVVPDSTNSNMVVIEMPFPCTSCLTSTRALLLVQEYVCLWKKIYSQYPNGY